MSAKNSFPLDDDIVDRILTWLPDFYTLKSTILVSKSIHTVFEAHPKSIIRAVAYNLVGPALPQALRTTRCLFRKIDGLTEPDYALDEEMLLPMKPEEICQIIQTTSVVESLEDLFSRRYITFRSSVFQFSRQVKPDIRIEHQIKAHSALLSPCAFGAHCIVSGTLQMLSPAKT